MFAGTTDLHLPLAHGRPILHKDDIAVAEVRFYQSCISSVHYRSSF